MEEKDPTFRNKRKKKCGVKAGSDWIDENDRIEGLNSFKYKDQKNKNWKFKHA